MSASAYRWMMVAPGAPLERREFRLPEPDEGQVVVAIAGCGVCHTDLGYYYDGVPVKHDLPLALGHEISGRVIAAGTGAEQWLGRAVVVPAVIPCGRCELCRRGRETICPNQTMPGYHIQGGFASHIVVTAHGLTAVDEDQLARAGLSLADVSVVADAVTTPYQAVVQAEVAPGDLAVVVGVGGVGGYCAQIARAFGAHVVALDIDAAKLEAIAGVGVPKCLNPKDFADPRELRKAIAAYATEQGLRRTEWKIFECSGTAAGQTTAFGLLVPGATLAVVGFTLDKVNVRLSNLMAFHARALGNWGCPPRYYRPALDLVLAGKVDLKSFVEQHPLDDINRVFREVHEHKLRRRAILVPND